MGARKQTDLTLKKLSDLTPEQYVVADSLYDLQLEHWRDISLEAREAAARACYPAVIEQLPAELRENMTGSVMVGGETPRYLRIPGWPELYDHPRLSVFQTPDEIHKALAVCNDYIKAVHHYRVHRDLEHVWKILSSSARRSLRDRLEQRISSGDSSPSW